VAYDNSSISTEHKSTGDRVQDPPLAILYSKIIRIVSIAVRTSIPGDDGDDNSDDDGDLRDNYSRNWNYYECYLFAVERHS
jgi:hypothetical protein